MTRQTVSICNIRGGVALDADEATSLAELLNLMARRLDHETADAIPQTMARLHRVIRVLRGEAPAEAGEPA
jgi:hypothetical protein